MVVTGDRDAYQLVDDGVRIMSTSRGVTDTKVYDRDAVIERYGIPPELVPGLHRPQGRHLRQHPRRPRHRRQDRRGPAAEVRRPRGRALQRRPDHGRQAQAEPDRARRQRAHVASCWRRWSATSRSTSTSRSSSRARRTARTCARSSATGSCATRCAGSRRRSRPPSWRRSRAPRTSTRSRSRPASPAIPTDITRMKGDELVARARCRPRSPRAS